MRFKNLTFSGVNNCIIQIIKSQGPFMSSSINSAITSIIMNKIPEESIKELFNLLSTAESKFHKQIQETILYMMEKDHDWQNI